MLAAIATPSYSAFFVHLEPPANPLRFAWLCLALIYLANAAFVIYRRGATGRTA